MTDDELNQRFDELIGFVRGIETTLRNGMENLRAELLGAQRAQERRKLNANGNIPAAIANLDLLIEELTERVRELERRKP
jgi:hypothetical protein